MRIWRAVLCLIVCRYFFPCLLCVLQTHLPPPRPNHPSMKKLSSTHHTNAPHPPPSRPLPPNLVLPNPLPHPPRLLPPAPLRPRGRRKVRPHGRRREDLHPALLPGRARRLAHGARGRVDEFPRRDGSGREGDGGAGGEDSGDQGGGGD